MVRPHPHLLSRPRRCQMHRMVAAALFLVLVVALMFGARVPRGSFVRSELLGPWFVIVTRCGGDGDDDVEVRRDEEGRVGISSRAL